MQTTLLSPTFVRKLSITLLTIKDSHDKNETCKNKKILYSISVLPYISNSVFNCISSQVQLSQCLVAFTFIGSNEDMVSFVPESNLYVDQSYNILNAKMYSGIKGTVNQFTTCCTIVNYKLDFVFLSHAVIKGHTFHEKLYVTDDILSPKF